MWGFLKGRQCYNFSISTSRGDKQLMTLEALFIQEIIPQLNTKDEFKSRALTIKF